MRHLCLSGLNSCPNSRSLALPVSTISLRTICRAMPSSSANTLLQLIPSPSFCIAQRKKVPGSGTDVSGDYPYGLPLVCISTILVKNKPDSDASVLGVDYGNLDKKDRVPEISMLIVGGNYDAASTLQLSAQL